MNYLDLKNILLTDKPSILIKEKENEIFSLIPEFKISKGFNQNNPWHIYDVYEHILHVVDGVSNNIIVRLAALFHDMGKPYLYTEDEDGVGHFKGHWIKSQELFLKYANSFDLSDNEIDLISKIIFYHDIRNLDSKLTKEEQIALINSFGIDGINKLYEIKKADLLAQNEKYHYMLKDLMEEKQKILALKKE